VAAEEEDNSLMVVVAYNKNIGYTIYDIRVVVLEDCGCGCGCG
jgi:hypothetical protein